MLVVCTENLPAAAFDGDVAAVRAVAGRHWDRGRKANVFPADARGQVWAALKGSLPAGTVVVGARVAVL